jgi:hypothetical protein
MSSLSLGINTAMRLGQSANNRRMGLLVLRGLADRVASGDCGSLGVVVVGRNTRVGNLRR